MELAEVLELRNSRRVLDRTDAQIRRSSSADLIDLFDWFAERTRAAGEPGRERSALWFAASRPAVAGPVKRAVSACKRVLAGRQAVLGGDHPDTIAVRASLADAYQALGKMPLAVELADRAAADSERVLGADHADMLARRAWLANLYYAAGRVGDAEALLRDALARCEQVLPPADPLTWTVQQSLASIAGRG